jgi:hypothetical protein
LNPPRRRSKHRHAIVKKKKGARAGHEVMTAYIRPPNQIHHGQ